MAALAARHPTVQVAWTTGVPFVISGSFDATLDTGVIQPFAGDGYGDVDGNFFSELDISHIAHMYVDVVTPGVTLVSESGHDYSSSVALVPEPSPWPPVGVAVLIFAVGKMRRYSSVNG